MHEPPLSGTVDTRFAEVRDVFASLLSTGEETGAGLAVSVGGRLVVDLVGGWRDVQRTDPWAADTLVHTFSVSKPFAALAALALVAQGELDLESPVATVWRAYGRSGKSSTSLLQVLAHLAAQPAFPDGLRTVDLYDAPFLESVLAAAPPEWEPGTAPAEHALTYGHLISGTIRAATGRGVGEVFRREVAGPLDLDAHFGVPGEDLPRVADVELSVPTWPVEAAGQVGSVRWRSLNRPPGALDVAVLNGRPWRSCEFPAIGLHATAASIAQYYGSLVDAAGAVGRLLGPGLHSTFCSPVVVGHDRLLEREVVWTPGLQADEYGLGMAGVGGCDAYVDTRYGFGYAYLTRRLGDHSRSERIIAAIESVLDG